MISHLSLIGAQSAVISGGLTPAELLDACLTRIEASEHRVRAWSLIDQEGARQQAADLGPAPVGDLPLSGIPVGVKDIIDVAGLPTTASSRVLAGHVATADAPVVARLRAAGALILGKTETQEFAYGAVTPQTSHPLDPGRIVGGSSGGSAAALASGHCLAALGTDTAGSIRIPAALCGVVGLKPRWGVLPVDGIIPLAPSLDVVGPMARTVADVALLWEVLSGQTVSPPAPGGFRTAMAGPAALPDLEPEVASVFDRAGDRLRRLGAEVEEVNMVEFASFDAPRSAVLMWEALAVHRSRGWWPDRAGDYTEETRDYLLHAERTLSPATVEGARQECRGLAARLISVFDRADVLVTPTVPCVAPTRAEAVRRREGSPRRPIVMQLTRIPGPVNVAGLAALSLPFGVGSEGLPVGLQLIARDEATVLRLGLALEAAEGQEP